MSSIDIGGLSASQTHTNFVGSTNPFDFYKFNLIAPGNLQLALSGLGANADLQLLDSSEKILRSSSLLGTSPETISIDNLAAGSYFVRILQVSGDTIYQLSLTQNSTGNAQKTASADPLTGMTATGAIASSNGGVDPLTGQTLDRAIAPNTLIESAVSQTPFKSGTFTVDSTGKVGIDFLLDGGWYDGELAIFSLKGMDKFVPGSKEFIKEVSRRALSDSLLGHVVIFDSSEAARFNSWEGNPNTGKYEGVKTFAMTPGDEFGVMQVPNGTVQHVFNNPNIEGDVRPLFSMATANPDDAFHVGQIADVTGDGSTFVMEDLRVDTRSDLDYNDLIFQVRGATGKAVKLDEAIDPAKDWRGTDMGQALIEYAKPYVMPDNPSVGELVSDDLIKTVLGTEDNSVIKSDGVGAIAPATEKPSVSVEKAAPNTQTTLAEIVVSQGEVTGASNPTSQNNNSVAILQPLVNQLLEEARQELIKLKQEQGYELSQFASELTQKINNLNQVSQNLWTDINTAHGSSYEVIINIKSSLDTTQTDLNQLSGTILSAEGKMGQQLSAFQNLIDSSERSFNNNSLHSSIQGANQNVINLSNGLWNDLYPKRTNYSSVWQQVEGIYNSRNEPTNQYNALLSDGKAVFDNARSQYNSLSQSKNIAISEAWKGFASRNTALNNAWKEYSTLVEKHNALFKFDLTTYEANNLWDEYYRIDSERQQFTNHSWSDYSVLKNSWDDWVGDTEFQLDTWKKIFNEEKRWYSASSSSPKVGLPLIGIIDTGFSANNPDIDYSRLTLGKDLVGGDDNPLLESWEYWRDNHGTKMLEIIAATRNNDIGINGINDKSPLWLGSAVGSNDWAQSLIEFVDAAKESRQPNAVVNLSFDLTQKNPDGTVTTRYELTALERAALTYAQQNNVLIVTSTGNQGSTMSALAQATKEFDNILIVGAAQGWQKADYSSFSEVDYANYGKGVDLLAQGSASNGVSGTSVTAAKVTGAASLVLAANPNLHYTQVIDILKRTATDLDAPNWDVQTGLGLLNIPAAVHLAKATKPEAYKPASFELLQTALDAYDIPEVYWPQFYELHHYNDLEAKLTGSIWSNPANTFATERPTADKITEKEVFRATPYLRNGLPKWLPDWVTKDAVSAFIADQQVNKYLREHPDPSIDGIKYGFYRVEEEDQRWSGRLGSVTWGVVKKVILEINETQKAKLLKAKADRDAAQKKVNDIKAQIEAEKLKAQQDRQKLQSDKNNKQQQIDRKLAETGGVVTPEIQKLIDQRNALQTKIDRHQNESNAKIAGLERQLSQAEKDLANENQAYKNTQAETQAWYDKRMEEIRQEQEAAKKGFLNRLSERVKQFSKDISENIKSNLDGVDVGAVVAALKKIPYVGTVVNGIEGLIALIQKDWKGVVKSGISGVLKIIPGGSAVPEDVVKILIDVGWGIISKDYKTALKDVLKELDVKDKLPNGKYVADVFVDVAWAMKDGDWKDVLSAGLSGAGFSNADKFVGIAWGVIDGGDYTNALTAGLEVAGLDKLGINSNQANAFVKSAIALKDHPTSKVADELLSVADTQFANSSWVRDLKDSNPNNDRAAVTQGLSAVGFKNVEQWVNMAWDVKDKNYLSAISTGFSLAGFSQGKDWVDMAWKLQQKEPDYLGLLSTGFKVAGFAEGEHLAKAAVYLRQNKYLDAFFEGIRLVPGVGDLINAFEAIGNGNFKGVANSLAKVATNPTLLELLLS